MIAHEEIQISIALIHKMLKQKNNASYFGVVFNFQQFPFRLFFSGLVVMI
jgi:hypothetical protein